MRNSGSLIGVSVTPTAVAAPGIWTLEQVRQFEASSAWLFNPSSLFAGGETGDWWEVYDTSTLFQDSAGSTPVTASGDPIGRVVGKKNGTALVQSTSGSRPTYTVSGGVQYASFDGTDDAVRALFAHVGPITRVMAFRQNSWTSSDTLFTGPNGLTAATFKQSGSSPSLQMSTSGGNVTNAEATLSVWHVTTEIYNGASSKLRVDVGSYVTGTTTTGVDAGGLTVAARSNMAAEWAHMDWAGGITIGRVLTDAEIARCCSYFGARAGLTL